MLIILNTVIAAVLGAFVGKYLAMVVHYLPSMLLEENYKEGEPGDIIKWFFQKPRCWQCKHPISWWDNAPLFGYLSLKGKCRSCHQPLGIRGFLLEIGTALLFGGSALFFPFSMALLFVLIVTCLLICCFITDFEHGILPDQFTMTIVWVALIGSLIPIFVTPREAVIGAVGGYGIFWGLNVIYHYFRGFEGMYPGDFKLNAGIGACVGLPSLLVILLISLIFLLFVTVLRFFYVQRTIDKSILYQEAPYGCYSTIVTAVFLYRMLYATFT